MFGTTSASRVEQNTFWIYLRPSS